MNLIKTVAKWLEDYEIFQRERKTNEQRALEILFYYTGLSYKKAWMFAHASHEAVREQFQKGKMLFETSIEVKNRKRIAVDEKEIKINGITSVTNTFFLISLIIVILRWNKSNIRLIIEIDK